MINVTQTYLPPFEEYSAMLKRAWDNGWVTNNGILVQELETKLKTFLGLDNLLFCANGTIVLQMVLKALGITREVITTPFSYVATLNAILWEGCTPVFADIGPDTFCIDAEKIEEAITENTEAILATHVYGFPCDVDAIQRIADKHQLKVIYDGAHAFGCSYKGKSLLDFGDISTCSFHATKIFFIRSKEVQSFATIKHCLIKYFITVSLAISMMNIFQLVSMPRILNYMLQWDCACYR